MKYDMLMALRPSTLLILFGLLLSTSLAGQHLAAQRPMAELYTDLPFKMPRVAEARFPAHTVSILDHGAVGNGMVKNTAAFARAIAAVAKKGGGTVVIPRGVWLTGPITLRSNIRLHTEAGALVIFSKDKDDYPIVATSFEGLDTYRCQSPINGRNLENVAITGQGIFDGSGEVWRHVKKSKLGPDHWKQLVASGGVLSDDGKIWYPSEVYKRSDVGNFNVPDLSTEAEYAAIRDYLRPVMISLIGCKKVLLDGPTFQNSPAWNIHPLMCEDVILRNLTVRNPWYSQNGDGIDLESCKNVLIYDNTFDVGDDAICFKSGKDEDGRRRAVPTENVIVARNTVYHGHGGFVIGSEMSGGVRNVQVKNCTFIGTDIGLRFKSTRGRGGVVEKIYISDIDMVNIPAEAIRFNLFYGGQSPIAEDGQEVAATAPAAAVPVTEETPAFRDIYLRRIRVSQSAVAAMFQGLPEMKLQNVVLEDASFDTEQGITVIDGDGITLRNIELRQHAGPALTFYNTRNASVQEVAFGGPSDTWVRVLGEQTDGIRLDVADGNPARLQTGQGASATAVTWE